MGSFMANDIEKFDIEKMHSDISDIIVSTKSIMYFASTSIIKMYLEIGRTLSDEHDIILGVLQFHNSRNLK